MNEKVNAARGFIWSHSEARDVFINDGGREIILPVFKPEDLDTLIRELPGSYSSMLRKESKLTLSEKILLQKWTKPCFAAIRGVL